MKYFGGHLQHIEISRKQHRTLLPMSPYKIIEKNSDGDLTVKSSGVRYIVTTDGKVFKEV